MSALIVSIYTAHLPDFKLKHLNIHWWTSAPQTSCHCLCGNSVLAYVTAHFNSTPKNSVCSFS